MLKDPFVIAMVIACLVVLGILARGIGGFGAGDDPKTANKYMRYRIYAQLAAVVVIGGMGSILGAIVTGFGLGLIEGLTRVFYPEGSAVVIFVIMAIVLLIKPAGLFGRTA